jgi:hypothetical protein
MSACTRSSACLPAGAEPATQKVEGSRGGYLGALEGDGAELEGEAVGEEDGLEAGERPGA